MAAGSRTRLGVGGGHTAGRKDEGSGRSECRHVVRALAANRPHEHAPVSNGMDSASHDDTQREHDARLWVVELRSDTLPDFLKGDDGEKEYNAVMTVEGKELRGRVCRELHTDKYETYSMA